MKKLVNAPGRIQTGFTLVELLVVIAIIAILAAMLLPAVHTVKVKAQVSKTKLEMSKLVQAISQYESDYSRMPITQQALESVVDRPDDFTFGYTFNTPNGQHPVEAPNPTYRANNSEVVAILMDLETFNDGTVTVNQGHVKNTRRVKYLNADMVSSDETSVSKLGGVGSDGVYRDVWGNPYVISLDADGDGLTRDAFYRLDAVSRDSGNPNAGVNGLIKKGPADDYRFNGSIMVWSAGPDRRIDPGSPANSGANKDNILSWKP